MPQEIKEKHIEHGLKLHAILQKEIAAFGASVKEDLQQQQSDLEKKDARIEALELEVEKSKEAVNVITGRFDALSHEFERVKQARGILEARCRRYKDIQKEWRKYYARWVEKREIRSATKDPATSLEPRARERSDDIPSAAPTPPKPPASITPTPPPGELEPRPPVRESFLSHVGGRGRLSVSRELSGRSIASTIEWPPMKLGHNYAVSDTVASDNAEECKSRPTTADSSREPTGVAEPHLWSDDSPILVSERTIKRKRSSIKAKSEIPIHVDKHVKTEAGSSSPILETSCRPAPRVQDSLDLDDVGRPFDTPKKRQRLAKFRLLSKFADDFANENNELQFDEEDLRNFGNIIQERTLKLESASIQSELLNTNSGLQKRPNSDHVEAMGVGEQGDLQVQAHEPQALSSPARGTRPLPSKPASRLRHTYGRSSEPKDHPAILGPKDPNVLPSTSNRKVRSVPTSRRDGGAAAVSILAEDGDGYTPSRRFARTPQMPLTAQELPHDAATRSVPSNLHSRLDGLLESQSAKTDFLQSAPNLRLNDERATPKTPMSPSKVSSVHRAHHQFFTTPLDKPTAEELPQTSTNRKPAVPKFPNNKPPAPASDEPPPINPSDEPLRARPLAHLHLTDFKLNKSHTEYTYQDTIRKHDEKRKAGGCRDPFCTRCKEIARFTALTSFTPPRTTTLFGSSPPPSASATTSTSAAEDALLLSFLGDEKARLDRLTPAERAETLQKAREKSFADLYGRHRQGHLIGQRAVSPPGYWETEFPSTQEERVNREKAREIERGRVRERWEEAVRGGVWRFADE